MDFRILGPLEVREDDRVCPLGGAKQRALLAILLINANRVVSVDKLVDDIWGEEAPATASNALQVYVSQLRKVLRANGNAERHDAILTQAPGYLIDVSGDDFDLGRFNDLVARGRAALMSDEPANASVLLRSALGLWRGSALADFTYEPFAQTEIERLEELRLLAFEDRIEADLALGRHAQLIPELEAAVAADPLRERLREHVMVALYRSGRQADALQVYQNTMGLLADQLGIDPSPALQRVHEAILKQDPSLELHQTDRAIRGTNEPVPEREPLEETRPELSEMQPATATQDQMFPVTVLFADIVGSTSLGERLTPDEVRAVIGECVSRMSRAVEQHDGMIQAYMGDGICAYFGLPVAHEDDVERAARTALRIRTVVQEFARELESAWGIREFAIRIGVNTGRTLVGLVGAASPQEVAFGDAMNVASRLESAAAPGSIVVGDAVAERLTHGFALKSLGKLTVKGHAGVEAWELLGASSSGDVVAPTPLVGRNRELERGALAMTDLESGRGQVLFLQGDAGIGKSRMLSELHHLATSEVTWLEGRCRSYGGDLPAWPFVEALRRWLGVVDEDPPMVVRMKLRSKIDDLFGGNAGGVLPFLGRFLSVDIEQATDQTLKSMSAAELADQTQQAFIEWARRLADRGPLVIAIEDTHDADALTRSLAEALLPITDEAPLLLALTARAVTGSEGWRLWQRVLSEYRHRAIDLQLAPLSDEAAGFLADALAPTGALDPVTKADIIARAAGNPLFVEELMRVLVDSEGLERRQGWTLTASSSVMLLPPALETLLVTRIQHLPPVVRSLAQAASVIGQEVPAPLLEQVIGAVDVHLGIGILLRSEIIQERRRYPELEYVFRHPLLREAALSTLTPAKARELYGRVATAFEGQPPELKGERLERLAYYFYRSDDRAKALEYLELAGEQAIELDAKVQAAALFERAAKVASAIGNAKAKSRIETLLASLGGPSA